MFAFARSGCCSYCAINTPVTTSHCRYLHAIMYRIYTSCHQLAAFWVHAFRAHSSTSTWQLRNAWPATEQQVRWIPTQSTQLRHGKLQKFHRRGSLAIHAQTIMLQRRGSQRSFLAMSNPRKIVPPAPATCFQNLEMKLSSNSALEKLHKHNASLPGVRQTEDRFDYKYAQFLPAGLLHWMIVILSRTHFLQKHIWLSFQESILHSFERSIFPIYCAPSLKLARTEYFQQKGNLHVTV